MTGGATLEPRAESRENQTGTACPQNGGRASSGVALAMRGLKIICQGVSTDTERAIKAEGDVPSHGARPGVSARPTPQWRLSGLPDPKMALTLGPATAEASATRM
ncbi:hypothetical protein NDU88_003745 [Pleurodeles waltl]|uniref:Uncharacterized protein n=1 Tax=Pleurodeles waltl TaxID=8319 RepID=A0AAV7MTC8_PLEWA|nr:hypothetical protein NDU88_003745 [Pleurodeles waltl]